MPLLSVSGTRHGTTNISSGSESIATCSMSGQPSSAEISKRSMSDEPTLSNEPNCGYIHCGNSVNSSQ